MKVKLRRVGLALLFLFFSSCTGGRPASPGITIAVASNLQVVMEEVVNSFTSRHGVAVEVASGSSGMLTAQIKQGAPFDLFLSANMLYPTALEEAGLTISGASVFAYGSLILWSLDGSDVAGGITSLTHQEIKKFAIANPETAPYGIAAMQALQNSSLMPELESKMIMGESIAQVNQYVSSGAVQVGITSSSVLRSKKLLSNGNSHAVDRSLYRPIEQSIVMLKNSRGKNLAAARLFNDFMFSRQAKAIFVSYGYRVV